MTGAILLDRLDRRLAALDLTDRQASLNSGSGPDLIRDLRRSKSKQMRSGNLTRLAAALECDPGYLTGGQDTPRTGEPARPDAPRASLTLSDEEMELIALMRAMPEERDHVTAVIRALYNVHQASAADGRGRRKAG